MTIGKKLIFGLAVVILAVSFFVVGSQFAESHVDTIKSHSVTASVEPTKVVPGDMMAIRAEVKDGYGAASVKAEMPYEGGYDVVELKLAEGDAYNGRWEGGWMVHDTIAKDYITAVTATNTLGESYSVEIVWSDPSITLDFVSPTPNNLTTITVNNTFINVSVTNTSGTDAVQFEWNFSGKRTNVTIYDQSSLVGVWHFDTRYGNTNFADDLSGNGNDGVEKGGVNCANSVGGRFGAACAFDGVDDFVNVSNEANFDFERTDPFSIELWIYLNGSLGSDKVIIEKWAQPVGWSLEKVSDDTLSILLGNTISNSIDVRSTTALTKGRWYHIAMTYNGSSTAAGTELYINGTKEVKIISTDTLTATILNNREVYIGSRAGSFGINGTIDEVRIYKRSLSADEINITYRSEVGKYLNANNYSQNFTDLPNGTYRYKAFGNLTDGTGNSTGQRTVCVNDGTGCPAATCTYSSGNWAVTCSDNCTITSNVNLGSNSLLFTSSGTFTVNANITTTGQTAISDACMVAISAGNCLGATCP